VRGYDDDTYGEAFADVYDDWYDDVSDVAATVALVRRLAGTGPVLELGVGTGRLAVPLVRSGLEVHGVDASPSMLERLRRKPGGDGVRCTLGDMVDDAPRGPFALVLVAYNTFFSLPTPERQRSAMVRIAERLSAGGHLVLEAFVPEDPPPQGQQVALRSMAADRVVLSVSVDDPGTQRAEGHLIELTEHHGVRLRPWSIRWARPTELDAMAKAAGLDLVERWGDVTEAPFTDDSVRHVSVYRRPS